MFKDATQKKLIAIVIVLRMVPKKLALYWVSVGIKIGDLLFIIFWRG